MTTPLTASLTAYLLTVFVHGAIWIPLTALATRTRSLSWGTRERLWMLAMIAPLLTPLLPGVPSLELSLETAPVARVRSTVTESLSAMSPVSPDQQTNESENLPGWPTVVAATWSLGSLLGIGWLVTASLLWRFALRARRPSVSGELARELAHLTSDRRRRVRLTVSSKIESPVALGPDEICLPPRALTLPVSDARGMLAHELAHLDRHDGLRRIAALLIERVLWIQPLFRLARRRLAQIAEHRCDQRAAEVTGDPLSLARCLLEVATWATGSGLAKRATAFSATESLLVRRVQSLLSEASRPSRRHLVLSCFLGPLLASIVGLAVRIEVMEPVQAAQASPGRGGPAMGWITTHAGLEVRIRGSEVVEARHHGEPIPESRRLLSSSGIRFLSKTGHDLGLIRLEEGGFRFGSEMPPRGHFIHAEDPAGAFTLEYDGRDVHSVYLGNRPLPSRLWSQDGQSLRILRENGELDFEVELKPGGGIRWTPRPYPSHS
ncbi:MAG: M56 family metallopeptidase [Planctomycetota bacterium]